jgi:nucleoside-diphosphate-sugar epimerase
MSEHEEVHQIGSLAVEYARLKDQVSGVDERVERAHRAFVAAAISFSDIVVHDDRLTWANSDEQSKAHLENLLGTRDLVELFHERSRLRAELEGVRVKLREWLVRV